MITRAQAEALLTLAESLEACERLGLSVCVSPWAPQMVFHHKAGGFAMDLGKQGQIQPMLLRLRIAEEIPRQEPAKKDCTKPGCFPYCDCDSIDAMPRQDT